MLLVLTEPSGVSAITNLNLTIIARSGDKYIFHFDKIHKSWRKGESTPSIKYDAFLLTCGSRIK